MNNFEQALKKLDRIEQNLNNQVAEIAYKDQLITEKDNRNAQLHELFQGTAKIFSKQHNFVDQLKEKLENEKKEKGISQEKAEHLEKDIERLDTEKKELNKRIKELEDAGKESKKTRDKELEGLRMNIKISNNANQVLRQKIQELTKVKMEREKSEERLKKQSEDFLKVQQVDQSVDKILGEKSNKKGLLLKSKEVIEKIKALEDEHKKHSKMLELHLNKEIWENVCERNTIPIKRLIAYNMEATKRMEELKKWTGQFPNQTPEQVNKKVLTERDIKTLKRMIKLVTTDYTNCDEPNLVSFIGAFPSKSLDMSGAGGFGNVDLTKLRGLLAEYQKEKFWWDKWIKSKKTEYDANEIYDIVRSSVSGVDFSDELNYTLKIKRNDRIVLTEKVDQETTFRKGQEFRTTLEICRLIIKNIHEYYKKKP